MLVGKSLSIRRSSHVQTFGLRISVSIFLKNSLKKQEEVMGWPCQITRGSLVARSWRNISFKHPPSPLFPPTTPANYPVISALITNLHQTDALLKHWLKAEKVNAKGFKIRRLFEKGRHLGSPNPERGRGAPRMCRTYKKEDCVDIVLWKCVI